MSCIHLICIRVQFWPMGGQKISGSHTVTSYKVVMAINTCYSHIKQILDNLCISHMHSPFSSVLGNQKKYLYFWLGVTFSSMAF